MVKRARSEEVSEQTFSARVSAVKYRSVLHHCVVIFFWSLGIMDCMVITFENRVPVMRLGEGGGVSGVASFITADEHL